MQFDCETLRAVGLASFLCKTCMFPAALLKLEVPISISTNQFPCYGGEVEHCMYKIIPLILIIILGCGMV